MPDFTQLVIASNNQKKRQEITHILAALDIEVVPIEQTVFVDVIEDGADFSANAKKKADAFMQANQLPALADDSGLCVSILDDAPGVFSARFSGEDATDHSNNVQLLAEMAGKTQRQAYFICALHLAFPHTRPALTATGKVDGHILKSLTGDTGFGYDPLFFSPELNKTFAQATAAEKATVSHRGRALRALQQKMHTNI